MSTKASSAAESSSTDSDEQEEVETNHNQVDVGDGEEPTKASKSVSGVERHGITLQQQMRFGEGGELEPTEKTSETTLEQFDIDVDHRDVKTRLDRPEASGIMRDDRPEASASGSGKQSNLFADAEEEQQTLDGNSAQNQCLFESNE